MKTYIFVSYGHDDFAPQVRILIDSLKKQKENYVVWWDDKLHPSVDYHRQIEDELYNLKKSKPNSCFIYIITPYSVDTERYNYCINEIEKALNDRVRILPIRLTKAQIPIQIGCLQWFDMSQCEVDADNKDFQNRLAEICKIIDSLEPIRFDGKQECLHNLLTPCQFTLDIDKHLNNYCPRQWMLDATLNWLEHGTERVLLLEGGPGTGKTAFSLWIATRKLPEKIHAWHLCQYNDATTRSLLTCVKSLTWYLASRLPSFYDSFDDWAFLEQMKSGGDENAAAAFKRLILENLINNNVSNEPIAILIDALDEASEGGSNGLANLLAQYADAMPQWLKFIITTRHDTSVTVPLKALSYVIDLDEKANQEKCAADIGAYVKENLDKDCLKNNEGIIDAISERSGNVILYAKLLCTAINNGEEINMLQLPKGLSNYYDAHMRRYFGANGECDFETYALPILQLMLASYQPIKRGFIYQRINETREWCKREKRTKFKQVLNCFGPLLKENEEYILPFHKSLCDWLTDKSNNGFYVSREDGVESMCEWGEEVLSDDLAEDELAVHFYTYQPQYLIEANRYKDLIRLFSNLEFWKRRRTALGIDLMFQRMFVELSLMNRKIKDRLFQSLEFRDVIYWFGDDLFNKGLFVQLKANGFTISLREDLDDKDRITALRYYYINGDFTTINNNMELFSKEYADKYMEPEVQNMLGLATKKCGNVSQSAVFFRNALQRSSDQTSSIYYHLNLSRVLTILCHFEEGRKELEKAMCDFYHSDWRDGIDASDMEFVSRQLEIAVRYVNLETELSSVSYNSEVCEEELAWADQLYSSKLRIDRYYPRHLFSKMYFLMREHRLDEIGCLLDELSNASSGGYDDIRKSYFVSLYQCALGHVTEGLQGAQALLSKFQEKDTLLIEKAECLALIDTLAGQNHLAEVAEELHPWYHHTVSIIKQIVEPTFSFC